MSPLATAELRISEQLQLPVDAMTEAIALLSTRGRGKTHTATVIAEEVLKLHHQVVIVDPVGLYWGLRSSAGGTHEGYRILVLGGSHGDLPLQASDAETIARFAVEEEVSIVIDLSALPTKAEQVRFCEVFFDRLWHLKQAHRSPVLLILEEAQEFAPQRPQRNEAVMLGRIERIAKLGRNYGIGLLMITQRPASLNKDCLDLAGILILLGLVAPIERKVARDWISGHGDQRLGEEVLASLPALPRGDAWLWWPLQGLLKRMHVRQRETFDSSATPKVGHLRVEPGGRAPINLDAFKAKLGGLIEKAKADDPRELRKRIAELERDLKKAITTPVSKEIREVEKVVEVPFLPLELVREYMRRISTAVDVEQERILKDALVEASRMIAHRAQNPAQLKGRVASVAPSHLGDAGAERLTPRSRPVTPTRPVPPAAAVSDGKVTGPQQRILDSLAFLESVQVPQASKVQLALLASASPKSSAYANNLGALRSAGLVDYPAGGMVALTDAGRSTANAPDSPPTTEELHQQLFSRLPGPQVRILQALIREYPHSLERSELAEAAEASPTSSAYANNLGALRSLGLIEYVGHKRIVARDVLFLEDR